MPQAFIGLGSNLGDRREALARAIQDLGNAPVVVTAVSSIYRTDPLEVIDQPEFLNQAVACITDLAAADLLAVCLGIEKAQGRVRKLDKGPRIIDLDVLLYGDQVIRTDGLEVPHPRLHLRRFVLAPLAEIAPRTCHPVLRLTIAELLQQCPDRSHVERLATE